MCICIFIYIACLMKYSANITEDYNNIVCLLLQFCSC